MGRIKNALNNLSIKKTFMLYMLLFLLLATLLSSVFINLSDQVRNNINLAYVDWEERFFLQSNKGELVIASSSVDYTPEDRVIINICNFIQIWSIPIFFGLCIVFSALLFYRNKLKKPIDILNGASEKIVCKDLNFHICYNSKDEMGRLCNSFETMRASLEENNREMWRSMEERKRLNATFSHDLRTPLTVLRGYTDLLKSYVPQGKISEGKLMSTVSTMSWHIARLENYVQMMSDVQRLEDISVSAERMNVLSLLEQLKSTAEVLTRGTELIFKFAYEIDNQEICIDAAIVNRVFENLLANAVRYAGSTIAIKCSMVDEALIILICDDGKGFTDKDMKQAVKPFNRNQSNSGESHFGLGLYICKILCGKHDGNLLIENGTNGGASVTAKFFCGSDKS